MTALQKNHLIKYVNLSVVLFFCLLQTSYCLSATGKLSHLYDITLADNLALSLPSDVSVTKNGKVCIVDGGNDRIVIFTNSGRFDTTIGSSGSSRGQFNGPVGIATDAKGQIYVADKGNHRIQIFKANGKLKQIIPTVLDGENVLPVDVAVSGKDGTIYVTSNNHHRILSYTSDGKLIKSWGGQGSNPGEFRFPATLTISADNLVGAVDVLNSRAQLFDNDGKHLATLGTWGVLPGQLFRPKGIATDDKGQFYISDSYLEVIQVFDYETRFLYVLGGTSSPHRFTSPTGIALDSDDRLFVAEMLANRISVYKLD